eukprot:m.36400 g.36400  ORF g.36400 m.36400 type:complete len:946 (+) comp5403_c0_seq1:126-2963(+)
MDRAARGQRRGRPQRHGRGASGRGGGIDGSGGNTPRENAAAAAAARDPPDALTMTPHRPSTAGGREGAASPTTAGSECVICVGQRRFTALGPCGHPICHTCALRIRTFNKRSKNDDDDGGWGCPICREELVPLLISEGSEVRPFDRAALQYLPKDASKHLYFDSEASRQAADAVTGLSCTVCPPAARAAMRDAKALKRHLSQDHGLFECDICAEAQMLFAWERTLFTRKELVQHKRGKTSEGKPIHPRCDFCDIRFFSSDELAMHMDRKHEKCHICEKQGKKYEYYINYAELETHFGESHYLCPDEGCRTGRFVVFATASLLEDHMAATHRGGSRGGKIELARVFGNNDHSTGAAAGGGGGASDTRRRGGFGHGGGGAGRGRGSSASGGGRGGGGGKMASSSTSSRSESPSAAAAAGDMHDYDERPPAMASAPPADLFDGPSLQAAAGMGDLWQRNGGGGSGSGGGASWVPHAGGPGRAAASTGGEEDFPALPVAGPAVPSASAPLWGAAASQPRAGGSGSGRHHGQRATTSSAPSVPQADAFPSLGGGGGGSNVSSHTKRPAILGRSRHTVVPRSGLGQPQPVRHSKPSNGGQRKPKQEALPPEQDPDLAMYLHPSSRAAHHDEDGGVAMATADVDVGSAPAPTRHRLPQQQPLTPAELTSAKAFPSLGGGGGGGGSGGDGAGHGGWTGHGGAGSRSANGGTAHHVIDPRVVGGTTAFIEPEACRQRNASLIEEIRHVCTDESFDSFKRASGRMRSGKMTPRAFFELCVDVLGPKLDVIFPELVVLLPNIGIQQDLYAAAHDWEAARGDVASAGTRSMTVHPQSGQVIKLSDVDDYQRKLDASAFPSLGALHPSLASAPRTQQSSQPSLKRGAGRGRGNGNGTAPHRVGQGSRGHVKGKHGGSAGNGKTGTAGAGASRKDYRKALPQSRPTTTPRSGAMAEFDW